MSNAFVIDSIDYNLAKLDLAEVRDAVQGQAAIKRKTSTYLPHPNSVDSTSAEQVRRYTSYIGRAEFDSSCGQTKVELVGAFTRTPHEIDLPDNVKYLEDDSDADWLSLSDSINVTFSNILEAKYHILVAEFDDGGAPTDKQMSKAEKASFKQRSKIVHYPREALTAWNYKTINGRMQLSNAALTTNTFEMDDNFVLTPVKTQILMGLDETGKYRQKKIVQRSSMGSVVSTDWIYPEASGSQLDYLPIEIVCDEKIFSGKLPLACGYLSSIAKKDVARYQVNADLKEKLAILQDTINTFGWTEQSWAEFKVINGRDYIATGAGVANQFPLDVRAEILKMSASGDAHFKYIEENEKQTRAMGGRYETDKAAKGNVTVIEVQVESAKENAVLSMIAEIVENSYRKLVAICSAFEGSEINHEDVKITVNRQFASTKMAPDDARAIKDIYDAKLIDKSSAMKMLKNGGYGDADLSVEESINAIEDETPPPIATTGGAHKNVEVQQK